MAISKCFCCTWRLRGFSTINSMRKGILITFAVGLIHSMKYPSVDCGDGTKGLLNDDYCDCPLDGRDEPLTSACNSGVFQCGEPGVEHAGLLREAQALETMLSVDDQRAMIEITRNILPTFVPSGKVLDGVQDCCDCSDEKGGWLANCKNRCQSGYKQLSILIKSVKDDIEKGWKAKQSLIAAAHVKKAGNAKDLVKKQAELKTFQKELSKMQDALKTAESREAVEFEVLEKKRAENCPEMAQLKSEKSANEVQRTENSRLSTKVYDLEQSIRNWESKYTAFSEAMKAFAPAEEIAKFDLNPPPPVPDVGDASQTPQTPQEPSENNNADNAIVLEQTPIEHQQNIEQSNQQDQESNNPIPEFTPDCLSKVLGVCIPPLLYPISKMMGLVEPASSIQSSISQHSTKIYNIEREISTLEKIQDYGPDNVWFSLDQTCMDVDVIEYNYELCFFGQSTQKKIGEGDSVNLGTFSRFGGRADKQEDSDKRYLTMLFEHGQGCWNGPSRSVEITFDCGPENKILTVEEPSRCEYTMKAVSPVACTRPTHSKSADPVDSPPTKNEL